MLASVVDDHELGITDIIRGDDHLNNAARQINICLLLGWIPPSYSHIPLIHSSDGTKLSKRDGALSVSDYKKDGYLAEAVLNYLLRLGWSYGDQEFFSINEMIEYEGPVIYDCDVEQNENVYPMIPSGKAHNEMLLGDETKKEEISDEGKVLV